jgi:hypothetical protein
LTSGAFNLITELARDAAHFDVAPSMFSLLLHCSNDYRVVEQFRRSLISTRRYRVVLPGRASTERILVLSILPVVRSAISTWSYTLTKISLQGSQHAQRNIIVPISRPKACHEHRLSRPEACSFVERLLQQCFAFNHLVNLLYHSILTGARIFGSAQLMPWSIVFLGLSWSCADYVR